jgi:hypothetical protein
MKKAVDEGEPFVPTYFELLKSIVQAEESLWSSF